jgi:hypothetical protein
VHYLEIENSLHLKSPNLDQMNTIKAPCSQFPLQLNRFSAIRTRAFCGFTGKTQLTSGKGRLQSQRLDELSAGPPLFFGTQQEPVAPPKMVCKIFLAEFQVEDPFDCLVQVLHVDYDCFFLASMTHATGSNIFAREPRAPITRNDLQGINASESFSKAQRGLDGT